MSTYPILFNKQGLPGAYAIQWMENLMFTDYNHYDKIHIYDYNKRALRRWVAHLSGV